ncbi:hypothetical protein OAF27_02025 [Verrucomicrobiales bacterium]|nr:hypothetical protein [Verrucomicrobiales bacterium]
MSLQITPELLEILRCPESKQPLREATSEELATFPEPKPEAALIREDKTRAYPVREGFPVLILDEMIKLEAS